MSAFEAAKEFVEANPEAARLLLSAGAEWATGAPVSEGSDPLSEIYEGARALQESQKLSSKAQDALGMAAKVAAEALLALLGKVAG